MVRLLAISQIFAKINKNFMCPNRRDCRYYYSEGARAKSKKLDSVLWSINGSNSPYSSVNATLHVESTKVAFNCGEGLQRLMSEDMRKHLTIFQHIFITRLDWRCLAGLPGVLLTLSNRSAKHLNVYGPSTLNHLCERIMKNMPRRGFEVTTVDCANGHTCSDTAFHIRAIPLPKRSEMNAKVIAYAGDIAAHRSRVRIDKCVDLNVTAAPLISQLAHGFDVTLDDGSVVRSADVTNYFPKSNFLVVDIPNIDYFHHLEGAELLLQADEGENTVFHLAPSKVIATEEYQNYMRKFPAGTMHVATDEKFLFSGHVTPHKQQTRLNQVDSQIFPALGEKIDGLVIAPQKFNEHDVRFESLIPSRKFFLRPKKHITDHLSLQPAEWLESRIDCTESIETFRKLQKEHVAKHPITERANEYPKIVFLGTGASCPDRGRNVPGILVRLSPDRSILLDCGEGTLGQLYRFYGDRTHDILATLKGIFISHLHFDHYVGVFNLLRQLQEIKSGNSMWQPIPLMGPMVLQKRLDLFNFSVQDVKESCEFLCNDQLLGKERTEHRDELMSDIGLVNIETCYVKHIPDSFGVSLSVRQPQTDSVFKLTYSGDTTPCNDLVSIGKNSTVLIHEATLEDDLAFTADHKKHSTVSQAVSQGAKMNAKYTILTHFSQRYRLPRLNRPLPHNVTVAMDNMELVESDLPLSHHLYNVLRSIYQEQMDELDAKAERRNFWRDNKSTTFRQT